LVVFVLVLSLMGMITGRPIMMLAYAAFFLAMSVVIYLTLRKKQRHFEVVQSQNRTIRVILAAVLMILAIIAPMLIALRSSVINLPAEMTVSTVVMLMLGLSILFIILSLLPVYLINRKGSTVIHRVIGYLVFIIAAMIPGLLMSRVDSTPMGIGSVYYVAMAVLILAYNAMGLYFNHE